MEVINESPVKLKTLGTLCTLLLLCSYVVMPLNGLLRGLKYQYVLYAIWFVLIFFEHRTLFRLYEVLPRPSWFLAWFFMSAVLLAECHLVSDHYLKNHVLFFVEILKIYLFDSICGIHYKEQYPKIKMVAFVFLILNSLYAWFGLAEDTLLAKAHTFGGTDVTTHLEITMKGIGGTYYYAGVLTVALYALAVLLHCELRKKLWLLLSVIVLSVTVFWSQFAVNTFLLIAGFLLTLFLTLIYLRRNSSGSTVLLVIFSLILGVYVVYALLNFEQFSTLYDRLSRILSGRYDESTEGRKFFYQYAWDTFKENPILGKSFFNPLGMPVNTGHTFILDGLARYGLFGFFPTLFLFYCWIKNAICSVTGEGSNLKKVVFYVPILLFIISNIVNPLLNDYVYTGLIFLFVFSRYPLFYKRTEI